MKRESRKILSCLFLNNVLCSFRRTEKTWGIMARCFRCAHFARFMVDMAEEDDRMMDRIDEMRRSYEHGEG